MDAHATSVRLENKGFSENYMANAGRIDVFFIIQHHTRIGETQTGKNFAKACLKKRKHGHMPSSKGTSALDGALNIYSFIFRVGPLGNKGNTKN